MVSRRHLLGAAIAGGCLGGLRQAPVSAQSASTISRGPTNRAVVSLTFDAGADRGYTASILDTLAAYGVRASFGVTGTWAEANGDLTGRIAAEGHHFINHTYSHRSFTRASTGTAPLSSAQRRDELQRTEQILMNLAGVGGRPWFRPPYGDYNNSVLAELAATGFSYNVMWSLDVLGWRGISQNEIVSRVLNNHGNGYIYLLHVGGQSQEGPALPRIIEGLAARGYGFATVPALLAGGGTPPPVEGKFSIGDKVATAASLNLRSTASTNGGVIATMPSGTRGTVVGGPQAANGYVWYQLDTSYGTGWAADQFLEEVDDGPVDIVAALIALLKQILAGI